MGCIKKYFGYCYYAFENDQNGDYVHIYDLYIYPKLRRQGRAKEILQLAIKQIRSQGYFGEIQIVAKPSENSIEKQKLVLFYKSLGLAVFDYYG